MKRSVFFLFSLLMAGVSLSVSAQEVFPEGTVRNEHNRVGVDWPRVGSDGRVYFKMYAPKADSIGISGHGWMTKSEDGWFTYISPKPDPIGFHYYKIIVDGVSSVDPNGRPFFGEGQWVSGLEIPAPDQDFYQIKDVPHGKVSENWYYSSVTSQWRRCFIYTPAGYDNSPRKKYPVLYLQHGSAEDETGWSNQGKMNHIMDNLIAEGSAVPMIVVMNSGDLEGNLVAGRNNDPRRLYSRFPEILIEDVIPFVESNYRCLTDRDHRAMAGLSAGAAQTFMITLNHLDMFSYIGGFSGAFFGPDLKSSFNGVFADADRFNRQVHYLFFGVGTEEDMGIRKVHESLTAMGIKSELYISEGTAHEWLTWRRCLHQFAPKLFK